MRAMMALLSALLIAVGVVGTPDRALASTAPSQSGGYHESGCKGYNASQWLAPSVSQPPGFFYTEGLPSGYATIRFVTQTAYALCPNGRDRIKTKWVESCYTWMSRERPSDYLFGGVNVKPTFKTKQARGGGYMSFKFRIGDDHSLQNCRRFDIPRTAQTWWYRNKFLTTQPNIQRRFHYEVVLFMQSDTDTFSNWALYHPGKGHDLRLK